MKSRKNILLIFLSLIGYITQAQNGTTANFLTMSPIYGDYNPAYYSPYKSNVSVLLSSIQIGLDNNLINYDAYNSNRLTYADLVGSLYEKNKFAVRFRYDLLRFGYDINEKNRISAGFTVHADADAIVQKKSVLALFKGKNAPTDDITNVFNGNKINGNVYTSLYAGYYRKFDEQLIMGARLKLLSGMANIKSNRTNVKLDTTGNDFTLNTDIEILTAMCNVDDPFGSNTMRLFGQSFRYSNLGFGMDLGLSYRVSEKVDIAFAVNDLGFINWKDTTYRHVSNTTKTISFDGVDEINIADIDPVEELKDFFSIDKTDTTSYGKYTSWINTSVNASAFWNLSRRNQLAMMWRYQFGSNINTIALAYNFYVTKDIQLTLCNAIVNEKFFNFGAGFTFNVGTVNLFLVVDNINTYKVDNIKRANVQAGLNVLSFKKPRSLQELRRYRTIDDDF